MPTASVRLKPRNTEDNATGNYELPEILRTPSGTVMLEIQGVINVGDSPLIKTELDLGPEGPVRHEAVRIGQLDLSQVSETGFPVKLMVGDSQLLRGKVVKLPAPLALLDMTSFSNENATQASDSNKIPCVEVITHKVVFNSRPEPVLSN